MSASLLPYGIFASSKAAARFFTGGKQCPLFLDISIDLYLSYLVHPESLVRTALRGVWKAKRYMENMRQCACQTRMVDV